MEFHADHICHIYNRGIDKQIIFYTNENYAFFLRKMERYLLPCCDLLAYCLMPNHLHLLIYATQTTVQTVNRNGKPKNVLSENIKTLLSSYESAINTRYKRTGSLFTQNTRAVCTTAHSIPYSTTCFHYIHQNPMTAKLVRKMEEWRFSSFDDYTQDCSALGNIPLAYEILDLCREHFYRDAYAVTDNLLPDFD